jgi:hypothetical protein
MMSETQSHSAVTSKLGFDIPAWAEDWTQQFASYHGLDLENAFWELVTAGDIDLDTMWAVQVAVVEAPYFTKH